MKLTHERLTELLEYNQDTGEFTWKIRKANRVNIGDIAGTVYSPAGRNTSYRHIMIDGRGYRAHRLAWFYTYKEWPKQQIDHIDRDGLNNAISNLRDVSNGENQMNTGVPKNNTSGVKGVYWLKDRGQWASSIKVGGRTIRFGIFNNLFDAACARKSGENRLAA